MLAVSSVRADGIAISNAIAADRNFIRNLREAQEACWDTRELLRVAAFTKLVISDRSSCD